MQYFGSHYLYDEVANKLGYL